MEKGEIITKQKGQTSLVMTTWKEKREINMLSTNCSPDEPPKKNSWRSKDGREEEIEKPAVVCNYNENMGGVDSSDQMRSYYPLGRKSHRWYKYIFWFLVDLAIGNAFVLWKKCFPPQGNRARGALSFRQALAKQLIGGYCGRKSETKKRLSYKKNDPRDIRDDTKFGHFVCRIDRRKKECVQCNVPRAPPEVTEISGVGKVEVGEDYGYVPVGFLSRIQDRVENSLSLQHQVRLCQNLMWKKPLSFAFHFSSFLSLPSIHLMIKSET